MTVPLDCLDGDNVHVVLLGDSTLDNGRYLDMAKGELSVEKQLRKRCMDRGWGMTVLAQDGSLLDDVRYRQLPLIPECATHIIFSASGNDLLSLLNEMVVANFTLGSMYATIGSGLNQVADNYKGILQELKALGCHLSCCTLYRPNFNHLFFKSLAGFSLGLHNSRIKQISVDLDCSVIDFANMFDSQEDFANPLELSTRGGYKLVENIAAFVQEHPISMLSRRSTTNIYLEDDAFIAANSANDAFLDKWGLPMRCCTTRMQKRRVYSITTVKMQDPAVSQTLETYAGSNAGPALAFSRAQEHWRNPAEHPAPPVKLRV